MRNALDSNRHCVDVDSIGYDSIVCAVSLFDVLQSRMLLLL